MFTSQAFSAASSSGLSSNHVGYGYFSTGQLETVLLPQLRILSRTRPSIYSYGPARNMASETTGSAPRSHFPRRPMATSHPRTTTSQLRPERHQLHDLYLRQGGREHSGDNRGECALESPGHSHPIRSPARGIPQHRRRGDRGTARSTVARARASPPMKRNYSYDLAGQVIYQGSVAKDPLPTTSPTTPQAIDRDI